MADTRKEMESRLEQLRSKRDQLNNKISEIKSKLDIDRSRALRSWVDGRADRQKWRFGCPGVASLDLDEVPREGCAAVHVYSYTSDAVGQFKAQVVFDLGVYGDTPGEAWQHLTELLDTLVKKIKEKAENESGSEEAGREHGLDQTGHVL